MKRYRRVFAYITPAAVFALAACAVLSSTAHSAAVTDLLMTEVDPVASTVEITNPTDQPVTVTVTLPFCHVHIYTSTIPAGTVFAPGQSQTFAIAAPALNSTLSDIWLYSDTNFDNPASIITGMKYGGGTIVGRETEATTAGKWPSATAFVPLPGAGQSLKLTTDDPTDPAHWASGAPNPGAYIGTGTAPPDLIPNIPKGAIRVELQTLLDNQVAPLGILDPNDGTGRLFVYDQAGTITILQGGSPLATPFADFSALLIPLSAGYDERGLLGVAFHPNFAVNGKVYTYMAEPVSVPADFSYQPIGVPANNQTVLAEWTVDSGNANVLDMSSRRELLRIDEPQFNHEGGELAFGPDGFLYLAIGDGGAADDQGNGHGTSGNGQNTSTILGTIIRVDVDLNSSNPVSANGQYEIPSDNPFVGAPGLDEIYAYGFRNPYRFSFDTATGDFYVADVGQNNVEEIDLVVKGGNYGWRLKEGSFYFDPNGGSAGFATTIPAAPLPYGVPLLGPIANYDHNDGISVIGGHVYHGTAIPELQGKYVFGDFGTSFGTPSGKLLYLDSGDTVKQLVIGADDRALDLWMKGLGQDSQGEIYILTSTSLGPSGVNLGGKVMKLINAAPAAVSGWEFY